MRRNITQLPVFRKNTHLSLPYALPISCCITTRVTKTAMPTKVALPNSLYRMNTTMINSTGASMQNGAKTKGYNTEPGTTRSFQSSSRNCFIA